MPQKKDVCSILDAGIDWFTVTIEDGLRSRFVRAKADRMLASYAASGEKRESANRLGYVGERTESFFIGERDTRTLVIGTGLTAKEQGSFFLGLATNVTRLDLAVTLLDSERGRDWTRIAQKQSRQDGRIASGFLTTHRIEGTPNGATYYIGSRSSDRFFRIYDKTAESKGVWLPTSWRWEVEYKKPRAGVVAARLLSHGAGPNAIVDLVASALADVKVTLPCGDPPSGWLARRPKPLTDDETRLRYTSRIIGPFLSRLVDSVGEERVRQALDLPKPEQEFAFDRTHRRFEL